MNAADKELSEIKSQTYEARKELAAVRIQKDRANEELVEVKSQRDEASKELEGGRGKKEAVSLCIQESVRTYCTRSSGPHLDSATVWMNGWVSDFDSDHVASSSVCFFSRAVSCAIGTSWGLPTQGEETSPV